jgi:AraC-like DNA-binding protein
MGQTFPTPQIQRDRAVTPTAYLSPKLALTTQRGFALHASGQPQYSRDWHLHDCAMFLWPQTGGLEVAWQAAPTVETGLGGATRLTRSVALLLPASTAHHTRTRTSRQRHGELYLAPELLGSHTRFGALRIDGALQGLLDALIAPALDPRSAQPLVDAIVRQLSHGPSRWLTAAATPQTLGARMVQLFARALEWEQSVPLVDDVARDLGVSTRQLHRACRQEFGASPIDMRRRLLAERARTLMAEGETLANASRQLGFATSGHLGRLLRALPEAV